MSGSFQERDWGSAAVALVEWLDETDRQIETMVGNHLAALVPLVIARSRAIEQLAGLLAKSGKQTGIEERLTAALARTDGLIAHIRRIRDDARQETDRIGRDRAFAAALTPASPSPARVDVLG